MQVMNTISKRLKTVLVVEDSAEDFRLLEHASHQVPAALAFHSVSSGEDAVGYLKGEGRFADRKAHPLPDLVLLDIGLPGADGFEVLAWIRSQPDLKELKVFVWTDASEQDVLDRATQAGANRFVPKSVAFVSGGLAGLISGIAQAIAGPAGQTEREHILPLPRPGAPASAPSSLTKREGAVGRLRNARHAGAGRDVSTPGATVQTR